MRLGALLLTPAVLTAGATLPWDGASELPWETAIPGELPAPLPAEPSPQTGGSLVQLTGDGTLHITDARGQIILRLGLSGRPIHLMRDAGAPMTLADFPCRFPSDTPLTKGLGSLPLAGDDFRIALKGLLWVLDDGQRRITLVHPATHQVAYLPLPPGEDWVLHFYPDRLEAREKALPAEDRREKACWSLPWLVLLPQFLRLSVPPPGASPGTALRPFRE
jgi:hypothetical protein